MGQCFSCRQSQARFRDKGTKICEHIHSAVSPLHEVQSNANGHLLATADQNHQQNHHQQRGEADRNSTSFPNMNITNPLKGLVSKQRNRYKKDGFDLDLTYITDNIIAMGYPASNIEGMYRNHIDDVYKLLETKHKDHYYIYNLCSERSYDISKFHNRVRVFPFDDHNPPKIELIKPFCDNVHEWLRADPQNVAVVHCKAGKGRTGTMICCYLLHSKLFATASDALSHYGRIRTQDHKGVTIPSQLRYVNYYARIVNENLIYVPVVVYVRDVVLEPVPILTGGQSHICFSISKQILTDEPVPQQVCRKLYKSQNYEAKRGASNITINLDCCVPLSGDVKLEFYGRSKIRKEKHFRVWFNTFFLEECGEAEGREPGEMVKCYKAVFEKKELDIVSKKDKQHKVYAADFRLTVYFNEVPSKEPGAASSWPKEGPKLAEAASIENPVDSSGAEESSESDEDDEWDERDDDEQREKEIGKSS